MTNAPPLLPWSYKMGPLTQSTIASTALAAAQVHAICNESLGQYPGKTAFDSQGQENAHDAEDVFEARGR